MLLFTLAPDLEVDYSNKQTPMDSISVTHLCAQFPFNQIIRVLKTLDLIKMLYNWSSYHVWKEFSLNYGQWSWAFLLVISNIQTSRMRHTNQEQKRLANFMKSVEFHFSGPKFWLAGLFKHFGTSEFWGNASIHKNLHHHRASKDAQCPSCTRQHCRLPILE